MASVCKELLESRGVKSTFHTNSLASTDNWSAYAHAMRQRYETMHDLAFDIRELMPRPGHLRNVVPGYGAILDRLPPDAVKAGGPLGPERW